MKFIRLSDYNNWSIEELIAPDQIAHIAPYKYGGSCVTLNSGKQTYVNQSTNEVYKLILLSDEEVQAKVQAIVNNKELDIYQRRDLLMDLGFAHGQAIELVPHVSGLY